MVSHRVADLQVARSKCHKNFKMKRHPRKVKWTEAYQMVTWKVHDSGRRDTLLLRSAIIIANTFLCALLLFG